MGVLRPALRAQNARSATRSTVPDKGGIFYPRAGTLGGCTAHNAMITVYRTTATGTTSPSSPATRRGRPDKMRAYFERLERCATSEAPAHGQPNPTRHGFDGWLDHDRPRPRARLRRPGAAADGPRRASSAAWKEGVGGPLPQLLPQDPNDWRTPQFEGICFAPLATLKGTPQRHARADHATRAEHPAAARRQDEQPGARDPLRRRQARHRRGVLGRQASLPGRSAGAPIRSPARTTRSSGTTARARSSSPAAHSTRRSS